MLEKGIKANFKRVEVIKFGDDISITRVYLIVSYFDEKLDRNIEDAVHLNDSMKKYGINPDKVTEDIAERILEILPKSGSVYIAKDKTCCLLKQDEKKVLSAIKKIII